MMQRWLLAGMFLGILGSAASADEPPAKVALCMACHGKAGVPINAAFPAISGQHEGYDYLELRDYKVGNRAHPAMTGVAATLEKPDMKALAAFWATQPWPALPKPNVTEQDAREAETIATSGQCRSCHLSNFEGDSAVPRLAGQSEAYLRATMQAFRSGQRANNAWMVSLLRSYSDHDIDVMARYLAAQDYRAP